MPVKSSNKEMTKEFRENELIENDKEIGKETSKENQKETKEPAKSQIKNADKAPAKECSRKEARKELKQSRLSAEMIAEEDEVIISNKTKLIEKKLIDEMQNQSSRDEKTSSSNGNQQQAGNSSAANSPSKCSSSAHLKSNAYKNGYLSAYENNAQKQFNRLLYTQNSFDSGFYSPSSNDSYNLSSTSGSCNALVYCSTSGSEQNTLNTNAGGGFTKKEFDKDSSIYLDSIDPPPTSMKMMPNRANLPRPIACFNGTSFAYWSASHSYRKYYSTEILSDWN